MLELFILELVAVVKKEDWFYLWLDNSIELKKGPDEEKRDGQ